MDFIVGCWAEVVIEFKNHRRAIRFMVDRIVQSNYQKIIVGHNESMGKLLVLDMGMQLTQIDQAAYHELMIFPAMLFAGDNPRVLIAGGGDGFAANKVFEFQRLTGVKNPHPPTIVDLDHMVVQVCKEEFGDLNGGSLECSNVIIGDILECNFAEKFKVGAIDLVDQVADSDLFSDPSIRKYKSFLEKDGIIVFYSEYMMAKEFFGRVGRFFKNRIILGYFAPFVETNFLMGIFSDGPLDPQILRTTELEGEYFCSEHASHFINLDRLPQLRFPETFTCTPIKG